MNNRTLIQIFLAITIGSLAAWNFSRSKAGAKMDLQPYEILGFHSGRLTSELLNHDGLIVLVIPDPGEEPDPVMDSQVKAFRKGLEQSGKVKIHVTARIPLDPRSAMQTGGAMPVQTLSTLFKSKDSKPLVGLVSFMPFPLVEESPAGAATEARPKTIVVSANMPYYPTLLARKVVDMVIIPKPATSEPAHDLSTLSGTNRFLAEYQVLKP